MSGSGSVIEYSTEFGSGSASDWEIVSGLVSAFELHSVFGYS